MVAGEHDRESGERSARVVATWADHDTARALHPLDHESIRSTEAARWLVVDLFGPTAPARDLFNACARLGSLMAEAGASPSLAAGAIDSALRALSELGAPFDVSRATAARASLVEGYVAAVRDAERAASLSSWDYPSCAVPLENGAVAIACGYPTDDGEALAEWAVRIAGRLVKAKVRKAVLAGRGAARAELASALSLVGIEVSGAGAPEAGPPATEAKREAEGGTSGVARWLRLPWRK
jgi:hypothetical protein